MRKARGAASQTSRVPCLFVLSFSTSPCRGRILALDPDVADVEPLCLKLIDMPSIRAQCEQLYSVMSGLGSQSSRDCVVIWLHQRRTRLFGGIRFARFRLMDSKDHNPSANVPAQTDEDPKGDRGRGDKTWTPPADEQGISNRPGDGSESTAGGTAPPRSLGRDDVIEDNIENEENRNAAKDVQ